MNARTFLAGLALFAAAASTALAQAPETAPTPPPTREDDPGEANRYFLETRGIRRADQYPWEQLLDAKEHNRQMPHFDSGLGLPIDHLRVGGISTWTQLGPSNSGGRTREIVIHPTNPSIMYAAAVSGGVWKSTDAGATWAPLADLMGNLAVNSLAMDPGNPAILYAGTGEGFYNVDSVRGSGIFKTTNNGTSWAQLAGTNNSNFHYVNDLLVSPLSSTRVYAATRTGIWRSTDSGTNWTQVLAKADNYGCLDLEIRSDQATDHVLASCGGWGGGEVRLNTDAGGAGSWTTVLSSATAGEANMGRTAIAIAPSAQATMYAVSVDRTSGAFRDALHAVYRSTDGGGTWTARVRNTDANAFNRSILSYVDSCACSASCSGQGWYDLAIAVDPVDAQRVWVVGIEAARSDDGGANWGIARGGIHVDMHEVTFHPGYDGSTNKTMYIGQDGGISRTTDARAALVTACGGGSYPWTTINVGYGVLQFYHGAVYPGGQTYFGGSQDNGTQRGTDAGGPTAWSVIRGGDGAYAAVNPTNTQIVYASQQNFGLARSDNGGSSFTSKNATYTDNRRFIQPYALDPNTPTRLWTAGANPWRTDDQGDNWVQRGTFPVASGSRQISAVAIAKGNSDRVLIATTDGYVFGTSDGTAVTPTWTNQSTGLGSGEVSSIAFDPSNSNTIWLTKSTFGGTHVYRSTDNGANWTLRVGSGGTAIPNIPAHSVVVHPTVSTLVYVGTDLGVYVSTDGGATWAVENTNFANVPVEHLEFSTLSGSNALYAFTHGRGAWRAIVAVGSQPGETPGSGNDALRISKASVGTPQVLQIENASWASAVGCGGGGTGNTSWVNRLTPSGPFPVQLDDVRLAFNGAPIGTPFDVLVYTDPDGDGNPANATLAARIAKTVTGSGFQTYTVSPAVPLASGDYWVGAFMTGVAFPALFEDGGGQARGWVSCSNGSSPASYFFYADAFGVRAHVVSAVTPGTIVMTWGNPCNAAGVPGQDSAVYRGSMSSPWAWDHASINCAVGAQTLNYVESSANQFYVVVPRTLSAEGSYGPGVPAAASPCLVQGTPDLCP